jgi:3-methyladenine DNA glycosylase AlkD
MCSRKAHLDALPALQRELEGLANPVQAAFLQRFFKTGPGEYAEGDRFRGIKVPVLRRLARGHESLCRADVLKLLKAPWHEHRLVALLILARQFDRAPVKEQQEIYRLYLNHTRYINNWDLVDVTVTHIVGAWLFGRDPAPLFKLVVSPSLWERRMAIVATHAFIRHNRFDLTLQLAEKLLDDPHDLIHKVAGWMLREVGKRDVGALGRFLDRHQDRMPRIMLRYAIERLPPAERLRRLKVRAARV